MSKSAWYAVRVRSRCEKVAAADLAAKGLEVCAATAPQRRVWIDRVRVVELPLFPGYIFAKFNPAEQYRTVERSSGVANIVRLGGREYPVEPQEMEHVLAVVASGAICARSPYLTVGATVRVRFGPLAGLVGILEQVKNQFRLVISVHLLQRSVSVEVDEASVEPVRAAPGRVWAESDRAVGS